MGTRHLICVYYKGRFVVAQIGLHKGDLHVTGVDILEFLTSEDNIEDLRAGLKFNKIYKGDDPEMCLNHQGPVILRDIARVAHYSREIELMDRLDFASDSLMCEWVYVVDLDGGVFEVYKSNYPRVQTATDEGRLAEADVRGQLLTASFKFAKLPDEAEFMGSFRSSYGS
jgi:hypothetical protein